MTVTGFDIPMGDLIVLCFKVLLALNIAAIPFYFLVLLFITMSR